MVEDGCKDTYLDKAGYPGINCIFGHFQYARSGVYMMSFRCLIMTSIALTSMAERAAKYTIIQRKNQLSKLCWYAAGKQESSLASAKDPAYLIA